jgi:hypothetical protein
LSFFARKDVSTSFILLLSVKIKKLKETESYPERSNDVNPLMVGEAIPAVTIPDASAKLFYLNN